MNEKNKTILVDAKKLLEAVDGDEFINTFLELQEKNKGSMTVSEFMKMTSDVNFDDFYLLTIYDYAYDFDDCYYIKDDENTIDIIRGVLKKHCMHQKDELVYYEYEDESLFEKIDNDLEAIMKCETIDDFSNIHNMGISIRKQKFTTMLDINGNNNE